MALVRYDLDASSPALSIWWFGDNGSLIDYSTGVSSWSLKIGQPGTAASVSITTGITGAAGAGVEPTGTPNVSVALAAGVFSALPAGSYAATLTATLTGGKVRRKTFTLVLEQGVD